MPSESVQAVPFVQGEAFTYADRVYYAAPHSRQRPDAAPGRDRALRVRRVPRSSDGSVDAACLQELALLAAAASDDDTASNGDDTADESYGDGPVLVSRRGTELAPTLVFPEEQLCASASQQQQPAHEAPADSAQPSLLAHTTGPPLLPPNSGGTPVHDTLLEALAATAASETHGARGIRFVSNDRGEVFESYKELHAAAWRMLGALQDVGGLVWGDRLVFQCDHSDRQLHIRALCTLRPRESLRQPKRALLLG